MLNKVFAAIAIAALAYAVSPADAARVKAGCSGDNLSKTETMIENMADGEGKIAAQKEIAAAQDAMLSGKAGCLRGASEQGDASGHGEIDRMAKGRSLRPAL